VSTFLIYGLPISGLIAIAVAFKIYRLIADTI
jgi:hypothetical protein